MQQLGLDQYRAELLPEDKVEALKGEFIASGAIGLAPLWEAVFADVGVALLAILNAGRLIRHPQ